MTAERAQRIFNPCTSQLPLMLTVALAWLLTACANTPPPRSSIETPASPVSEDVPALRYGRYRLVEVGPEREQQDLLSQVVDVTLPAIFSATVGDALRYVLMRSGYALCEGNSDAQALQILPLPAPHLRIGPMTLRQALQLLAGAGWQLQVDDAERRVCFSRRNVSMHVEERAQ